MHRKKGRNRATQIGSFHPQKKKAGGSGQKKGKEKLTEGGGKQAWNLARKGEHPS